MFFSDYMSKSTGQNCRPLILSETLTANQCQHRKSQTHKRFVFCKFICKSVAWAFECILCLLLFSTVSPEPEIARHIVDTQKFTSLIM